MNTLLRRLVIIVTVAASGSLGLFSHAEALPSLSATVAASSAIVTAQYAPRHPWFRHQAPIVVPKEAIESDPNLAAGGFNAPVVRMVPVRPTSCGEFHYWDGERCVDARYNNPYLGRR